MCASGLHVVGLCGYAYVYVDVATVISFKRLQWCRRRRLQNDADCDIRRHDAFLESEFPGGGVGGMREYSREIRRVAGGVFKG